MKPIAWAQCRHGIVIAPNWLGDALMALPALRALETALPEADLAVLARPAPAAALAAARLRTPILPWPAALRFTELLAELRHLRRDGRRLRNLDFALLLPNSFHAALQAFTLGARLRIGYQRDRRGWLLTHALPLPQNGETPSHESFYYLELLRRAGLIASLPPTPTAQLWADEALCRRWSGRLAGAGPLIVIHAGAAHCEAKRWPPEYFAALLARLPSGCRAALVGRAAERPLTNWLREQAAARLPLFNLAGETSLPELLAVLSLADLVVANDSGPMHLAAALGRPLIALFGPTNEKETYPLGPEGWPGPRLLLAENIACHPCKLRTCPIDHRCMQRLRVQTVLAAIEEHLRAAAVFGVEH